ncbi:UXP [Simian adenovirus 13]|uniref:UXP n=1 Tax=Simian adenovirus 13 TaxID=38432 RepID=A0A0M3TH05_9ADEN|nr:UXP [Simian adenovirus 13]ALE30366.1 UXP [Simian adenovirus 13]
MNIIDSSGKVVKFDMPFRVWRKFASRRSIGYQSWEEGKWVKLDTKATNKLTAEFIAFAARFSSPKPSNIFGTSSKEAKSGKNNGQQSGPSRSNTRKSSSCAPKKESAEVTASPAFTRSGGRQRRRGGRVAGSGVQLPSCKNSTEGGRKQNLRKIRRKSPHNVRSPSTKGGNQFNRC